MPPRGLAKRKAAAAAAAEEPEENKPKQEEAGLEEELTLSNAIELWHKAFVTGSVGPGVVLKTCFGENGEKLYPDDERSEEAQGMLRGVLHASDAFDQYIARKDTARIAALELEGSDVQFVLPVLEGTSLYLLATWPQKEPEERESFLEKAKELLEYAEGIASESTPTEVYYAIYCGLSWVSKGPAAVDYFKKAASLDIPESTPLLDTEIRDLLLTITAAKLVAPCSDVEEVHRVLDTIEMPLEKLAESSGVRTSTKAQMHLVLGELFYATFTALVDNVDIDEGSSDDGEEDGDEEGDDAQKLNRPPVHFKSEAEQKAVLRAGFGARKYLQAAVDHIDTLPLEEKSGISIETLAKLAEVLAALEIVAENDETAARMASEYNAIVPKIYPDEE